jgi:hypothetical protein
MENSMKDLIKTALSVLALLGPAAIASGCGEDHDICPELCERSSECPDVLGDEDACNSKCTSEQEAAEDADCGEQWEAYQECASHSTNLCTPDALAEECSVQLDSYNSCKQ